jgi:putative iron-dependent peroxidase
MPTQPGVFSLGTSEHCYLELDLRAGADPTAAVTAVAELTRDLLTTSGVNIVSGVRPALWATVAAAHEIPAGAIDWDDDIVGPDGFTMPATPHDLWLWIAGGSRTAVFDTGRSALAALDGVATLARETTGWVYRDDRDLTGFIDGTENPSVLEAPDVVSTPAGAAGAGSTIVLHQLWRHDSAGWESQPVPVQEDAMGRSKLDSVEMADDVKPADAHIARTVVEVDGKELDIFRRNVAYGGVTEHGTVFVGFSFDQWRMAEMLRRMAGIGGPRDALTRYTTPFTGAYYVVPSVAALARFAPVAK